jgi:hypothetical protein
MTAAIPVTALDEFSDLSAPGLGAPKFIRQLATGAVQSIPRGEVKEVTLGGTVMPDGLTAGMGERQLAHLVRYLMGLGAE